MTLKYYTQGDKYKKKIKLYHYQKKDKWTIILDLNLSIGQILKFKDNKWHINTKLKYNIIDIENILNKLLDRNRIKNNNTEKNKINQIIYLLKMS